MLPHARLPDHPPIAAMRTSHPCGVAEVPVKRLLCSSESSGHMRVEVGLLQV